MLIFCFVFFLIFANSLASYCGKSGVPYSLEVLPNGAPVLGCAQPSCVISALDADGEFQEDSQFLTDGAGQSDGFFRDGDRALKRFRHSTAPKLIANCSGQFNELSCPRRNQWVGGIEYIDHPRQPLILQCCTFEGLRFSQEVGSTSIGPGEAITGGEVVRGGRQISFDVIANVVKKVAKQENNSGGNKITYEVTVRRMNCLPDPPEPEVELDLSVPAEVAKILSSAKNKEVTDKFKDAPKGGKQPVAKKQRPEKQKAKQQAATIQQELPEISGGEGDRPTLDQNNPVQSSTKNNEAIIQAGPPRQQQNQQLPSQNGQFVHQSQGGQQQGVGQFIPQQQNIQQQPQLVPTEQFSQQQQFIAPGQFPTLSPTNIGQEFQAQNGGQQFQQQIQNGGDSVGIGPIDAATSTVHPLLGGLSFPTHSFPTFPPHSFPTLPPHTFPTLPPHTFPTFAPHTFPTFGHLFGSTPAPATFSGNGGFQQGSGTGSESQSAVAFAAPSLSAPANGPIPLGQQSSAQSNSFASANQRQQQQYQNPHSPFRRENNALPTMHHAQPKMAPAMGTVLAAMQGQRYPVMHPILGLIGYSNSAPSGK